VVDQRRTHTGLALLVAAVLLVPATPAQAEVVTAAGPVAQPPAVELQRMGRVSRGRVPIRVSWPAATPAGSPIYRYQLQRRLDGGRWSAVSLATRLSRSVALKLRPWRVIEFRVRAKDQAGNAGAWAMSEPTWLSAAQESDEKVDLTAGWQTVADSKAFAGRRATTTAGGEVANYSFFGSEVGWIAQRGPRRGRAHVYLDGAWTATLDLYRARNARRRVVFRASWASPGAHTLEIRTAGTPGRPRVDVDAFVVLGAPLTETLVGAGDIASCQYTTDTATAAIVEEIGGIVFTAGDNVYPDGSAPNFKDCYGPSWGGFKGRTRPTPGNHDYQNNPGAAPYFAYFGSNAGPAGRGWYRYQAGTWRVYALNSECSSSSACGIAQHEWLQDDLAAEPHRCVAAIWHRPRWSTGPHGNSTRMAAVLQLLYDAGAELVITGHDHNYQRFAPAAPDGSADPTRGVRQFVVGTGGAANYGFQTSHPLIEARNSTSHGVLKLDLAPGNYAWEFLATGGSFTDSGEGACH